jgi:antitoxin ChpS
MLTARLRKVGGSVMLAIPPSMLEAVDLAADMTVGVSIKSGKLLVEPRPKHRYTLDELLAQCDPDAPLSQEQREWLDAPAVGRERI